MQKIAEEQQLRQDLQVKLLQSEQQLKKLKQNIGAGMVSNGPDYNDGLPSDITPSEYHSGTCRHMSGPHVHVDTCLGHMYM